MCFGNGNDNCLWIILLCCCCGNTAQGSCSCGRNSCGCDDTCC